MAVGDIMLGDRHICMGHGVGSMINKKGPEFIFEHVASVLKKADIVFGNLEAVLSRKDINEKCLNSVALRAEPDAVRGLTYAGFNVLSLANNHILEHGNAALSDTMDVLSRSNIPYSGVNKNLEESRKPFIISINDFKIAFLAYCLIRDKTAFCSVNNPQGILNDIKKTRREADIIIVSLHWGREYMSKPSPSQIKIAHQIIDAGADVILGHHAHTLQGVEIYNDCLIAYNLGNFVFDMFQKKTRESAILKFEISGDKKIEYSMIPVLINDSFQPEILKDEAAKEMLTELGRLSSKEMFDLSDSEEKSKEYEIEAELYRSQYRRDVKKHFITNIHRYRPIYLTQILHGFVKKRMSSGDQR